MKKIKYWSKICLSVLWRIIKSVYEFITLCLAFILYCLSQIFPYVFLGGIVILLLSTLLWITSPKDAGPYYAFGSGWDRTTYLKSKWECEVVETKNQYKVHCNNLEDNSVRDFFTDYYEEGLHTYR